jgi:hypothetical protein
MSSARHLTGRSGGSSRSNPDAGTRTANLGLGTVFWAAFLLSVAAFAFGWVPEPTSAPEPLRYIVLFVVLLVVFFIVFALIVRMMHPERRR